MSQQRKYKINEIFYSLQAEGYWAGTAMVFVRFSGCNLKCDFCDTEHFDFKEMTASEVLEAVDCYSSNRICITGGEPTMQLDSEFISTLKSAGKILHIETNGTIVVPDGIDWVTISPKTEKLANASADEVKVVYQGKNVDKWLNIPAKHYFLQPCSCLNTNEVIDYILKNPRWRMSVQIHKLLNFE